MNNKPDQATVDRIHAEYVRTREVKRLPREGTTVNNPRRMSRL